MGEFRRPRKVFPALKWYAKTLLLTASRVELHPGDYVTISASRYPFANVMPQGSSSEDWIGSISRTLNWNSRQRQKSFKEWEEQNLDKKAGGLRE